LLNVLILRAFLCDLFHEDGLPPVTCRLHVY
jgi:hypothetical protein